MKGPSPAPSVSCGSGQAIAVLESSALDPKSFGLSDLYRKLLISDPVRDLDQGSLCFMFNHDISCNVSQNSVALRLKCKNSFNFAFVIFN